MTLSPPVPCRAMRSFRCRYNAAPALALTVALALALPACGTDLASPRDKIADHVGDVAQSARERAPDYARSLRESAKCLGSEISSRLGKEDAQALLETKGDLSQAPDELQRSADKLRVAVQQCVELRPTLVGAFRSVGLTQQQAECVADRALTDDKILTPLLVNIIFGDPGVGTAIAVAVRASQGCVGPEDLKRLFPG